MYCDQFEVGDLVELDLTQSYDENVTIIGIVLRIDAWAYGLMDLYVYWQDGYTFWCNSVAAKKLS